MSRPRVNALHGYNNIIIIITIVNNSPATQRSRPNTSNLDGYTLHQDWSAAIYYSYYKISRNWALHKIEENHSSTILLQDRDYATG